ncbi:sialate O-acetylesterase [Hafnia paralvei]|uniref:tail fiber/spike domain-containing protein n=1 Tax=Hafnia paralvei TaxID=546367 RepID=UPI0024B9F243|nr:sialate O-acetylesterase [Hafnia paralvei]
MATQPTNLPVPSESPRDLKSNAGKIDEFVTSRELKYIDRFGEEHYTIEGISQLSKEAIASFGYITMDSFEDGNTLTLPNQVLRLEATGEYYRWDGAFPKVVPAASTPESTGGIGIGKWLSVGDATLRGELADVNSDVSIAGVLASQVGGNATKTKYLEAPDVYDLIVTYGQSNSAGEAILSGDTSGFPNPLPKSLMYDFTDGTIKPIIQSMVSSSGVASSGHAWGEFANEWYRLSGHGSVTVHCGRGATSLSQLSKGAVDGYYSLLVSAVSDAKARMAIQGLTVGKTYVLFHQGETDQLNGTTFDSYRGLFVSLIDNLSADIGVDRFANCTVGCPKNRPEYSWATIQNAQRYVCSGRDVAVTAFDGCPSFLLRDGNVGTEGVHYTQKGYNTMGAGAARGLWSVEKGGTKSKTDPDLAQYTNNGVAGWSRAKHASASARYGSSAGTWQLLHKDNDTGVLRPANINAVSVASDGNSFLFTVADNAACWFDFRASLSRDAYLVGLEAIAEPLNVGVNFNLRVAVYADIDVAVNVNTGELRSGRPLSALTTFLSSLLTVTASSGTAVITHPATNIVPQVSYYSSTSLVDTSATVGVYCPDNATTRVYAANVTTSPWVLVSLKKILVTPAKLSTLGCTVSVTGTYAPEF